MSFWCSNMANFDRGPGVTGDRSRVTGHGKTLKFKQLGPDTKLDVAVGIEVRRAHLCSRWFWSGWGRQAGPVR